jgi:hypothetical protein
MNIEHVAAILGDQTIDLGNLMPIMKQPTGKVATNKTKASSDQGIH